MESFASPTCFFKEQSESLKTLTFKGSISIEQVQKIISVVETSSEQLYLGISDETLMISLNTGALVKPTEENFRQNSKKRMRTEHPFEQKIEKSVAALKIKLGTSKEADAKCEAARDLLLKLTSLKDVASASPAVENYSVFVKGENFVIVQLELLLGARLHLSSFFRNLGSSTDGAISVATNNERCYMRIMATVDEKKTTSNREAAPAPPSSPNASV